MFLTCELGFFLGPTLKGYILDYMANDVLLPVGLTEGE